MQSRLLVFALVATLARCDGSAAAQSIAPEIKVSASGSGKSCVRNAESAALPEALRSIGLAEPTMASVSSACLSDAVKRTEAIRLKARQTTRLPDDRCEVTYTVLYDRGRMLAADRACRRTDVRAPVGLVLRGEVEGEADATLSQQAISQITAALTEADFEIVSLPQFQSEFLDLKLLVGTCAFSGNAGGPDWTDECRRRFAGYAAARDALAGKVGTAIAEIPELHAWKSCGGLFASGEVRVTRTERTVVGQIDVDYYALADSVTYIAPFSDSRPAPIDQGGAPLATSRVLAQIAGAAATDATQKLARFAHSRGCATPF